MKHPEEILSSSFGSIPPPITWRPKLITKQMKCPPVLKKSPAEESSVRNDDQKFPRNCVSVVLKTGSSNTKTKTVSQRALWVEELSAKYQLKYEGKSSQGGGVRLEFCFEFQTEARDFFGKINDWVRSENSPKLTSVILTTEESLGED